MVVLWDVRAPAMRGLTLAPGTGYSGLKQSVVIIGFILGMKNSPLSSSIR
jgi:hypothetical protein